MNDTPEEIRQQMEETKIQLSEKLESLETQVSNTVQSTGTAVNATVEAVQETVETVTGAVQDAVQSVSNAFDLRRQLDRHPWLILGGAAVLGYLAVDFLTGRAKKFEQRNTPAPASGPSADNTGGENGKPAVESATNSAAIAAAYESGRESSSRHQLQDLAIRALIGVVQDAASQALPQIVDYLTGTLAVDPVRHPEEAGNTQGSPERNESPEAAQRLRIASSESVRTGGSF
jgi:hypothetical protein